MMFFSERYKNLYIVDGKYQKNFFGDFTLEIRRKLKNLIFEYDQPRYIKISRYDRETTKVTASLHVEEHLSEEFGQPIFYNPVNLIDIAYDPFVSVNEAKIFDIIECWYDFLSQSEQRAFSKALNSFFAQYDLPWKISEGEMVKVDASVFEFDSKGRALERLKKLGIAEVPFQNAFMELRKAVDFLGRGDYGEAILNAEKSFESVLKILSKNGDSPKTEMLIKSAFEDIQLPGSMTKERMANAFEILPYIRNRSGSSHGSAKVDGPPITKDLANLAVNLACAFTTYFIDIYRSKEEAEEHAE